MRKAATICINCMNDKGSREVCPCCAYDERLHSHHPLYLKPRTVLKKQYIVGKVLGQGGFGITYLGLDTFLNKPVAIKEYLPATLATRDLQGNQVIPLAHQEAGFAKGLGLFLDEARHLARFRHPHIVRVFNYFEANRSGYMVMEYLAGPSPAQLLRPRGGRLPQEECLALLLPLLDALEQIHAQQVYHLDLCAHNVRLAADGQPVLIDFGASRQIIGDYTHSLALVLRPGYSPLEQYADKARIGPWTDIYACGALLYVLLCGRLPPSAPERLDQDRLQWPSELGIAVHPGLEAVLRKSLALRGEDRWQSIAQLRQAFAVCAIAPAPLRAAMPPPRRAGSNIREGLSPLPRRALIAMILLLLALPAGLRWLPQAPPENVFPAPLPDTASRPLPTPPPPDTPLRASAPLEAPPAPREDSAESEPRQLLARAEAQLRERKLTTPPGDNAYETYRDLLARRPEHPAALAGLRRIAEEYLKLAREAEANKQQEWIRKGLAVWPEHPGLLALQEQIKPPAPAPEAVPDPELALYPAALAALNRGRWEQAYRLYQRILLARPGDPEARQGITQIAEAYRQAAEKDYREGKLAESLVWVAKGLAIAPENARLTALQAEIGIALEKPATEPAAPAEPKPVPSPSPPMLLTPTF